MMQPAISSQGEGGLLRVRLDVAYDGAGFSGWAAQPGRRTVQGTLEDAFGMVVRIPSPSVTVAGRTDAGVHARGQVCHVDMPRDAWESVPGRSDRSPHDALVHRLAGAMPSDVRVTAAAAVPHAFDARFSALWRRYVYRVTDAAFGADPLSRGHVLAHPRPLDIEAMNAAAAGLHGEHDFAAYCRRREGATTIRRVHTLHGERSMDGVVVITVTADAFCHNQVRAMVGALLCVGDGRRPIDWPAQVLAGGSRVPDVPVVAAHGLTLEEVGYPHDDELAARAAETRRMRSLIASTDRNIGGIPEVRS